MHKKYLGDGLYVQITNGMIHLTAENGVAVTDEVFLEAQVLQALWEYVENIKDYGSPV